MRKIIKNGARAEKCLSRLPKIYLICYWARYGVREYPFAGKYDENGVPLVYDYHDANGHADEYLLMPITHVTTGIIQGWSFDKAFADKTAVRFNLLNGYDSLFSDIARQDPHLEYSGFELLDYHDRIYQDASAENPFDFLRSSPYNMHRGEKNGK